jgi:histidyl-tRNA synthetase
MQKLRANNISCELYPETTKLDKQFKYADKKNIQYAAIVGSKEMEENICLLKNLKTGIQETVPLSNLLIRLQQA